MEEVEIIPKKERKFNYVWFLPIIALFVVVYLFTMQYLEKGTLITIEFKKAEGITLGKTKLRYKDVDFGVVEDVKLSDNLETVTISARVDNAASDILREGTEFWIVKPRVGITQVTGLETLLSGVYITASPSKEGERQSHFVGLDNPPLISANESGLKLTLVANDARSINPGTVIYYKGIEVGTVERRYFSDDYSQIMIDIFIKDPHHHLITSNTRFWQTSGISLETRGNSFSLQVDSLEALIAGGINFDNFDGLDQSTPITQNNQQNFVLYANSSEAKFPVYSARSSFVLYFDGSVRGLYEGAPVEFNGMPVGEVKDISLRYDPDVEKPVIPVLIEIYEKHISHLSKIKNLTLDEKVDALVRQGLYAQLETSNLISGSKYVSLILSDDFKDKNPTLATDQLTGFLILPTRPESFTQITTGLTAVLNKVNKLPLEDLIGNLNQLLDNADKLVSNQNIDAAIANLNKLLADGKTLPSDIRATLDNLDQSLQKVSEDVDGALTGLSPDAPLYYNLNNTLKQLDETLRSIESVTEMIDRTPNALIFGEDRNETK